jgi:hypothetical protein
VNRIAKWDGSSWSALGSGTNVSVNALGFGLDSNLYAGGSFTSAGDVSANYLAKWDGSSWSALGTGTNNNVNALDFDSNNNLYIGGEFTIAGTVNPANRVAEVSNLNDSVDTYVNSKFLYSLEENQCINVTVTKYGVPYTNGLLT